MDTRSETDESAPENRENEEIRVEITRDHTFSRAVADEAAVTFLGRDLELSFLQLGHILVEKTMKLVGKEETEEGFVLKPALAEVSRVRMSQSSAVNLAMNILNTLAMRGRLKSEGFEDSFQEIRQAIALSDSKEDPAATASDSSDE